MLKRIYPDGLSIPQKVIQDLKEINPDAGLITIYEALFQNLLIIKFDEYA